VGIPEYASFRVFPGDLLQVTGNFTPLITRRAQAAIGQASQAVGVPFGFPFSPIVSATVFIPSMVSAIS